MIEILSAQFENVVSYKSGQYDYTNNNGLTVVSGHNKDSLISNQQNNGAGKSLLFSMLPNVVFESTPLAQTKERKAILQKGSRIAITIRNRGHEWKLIQEPSRYIIERDGVDLEVRGLAGQRKKISEVFPLSESEWYSYVYLQSQKPCEFQQATARARLSYITEVWRLDQYDLMRKYFEKKVDEVKRAQAEFDVHQTSLTEINKDLQKNGWNRKEQVKLNAANKVVKSLSGKVKKLQAEAQELRALLKNVEFYAELVAKRDKIKSCVKFDKAALKSEYALLDKWTRYEEDMESYAATSKKLKIKIEECGGDSVSPKAIKKLRDSLNENVEKEAKLSRVRDRHDEAVRELENLDDHTDPNLRSFLSQHKKAGTDPMRAIEEEMAQVKSILSLSSVLEDCDDGKCPTCQQNVNVKQIAKAVEQARKRRGKLHSLKHAYELSTARRKWKGIIEELAFNERDYYALRKQIKKDKASLDDMMERLEMATRVEGYKEQLSQLKKPKAPKEKATLTYDQIEEQAELIRKLASVEDRLSEFSEVPQDDGLRLKLRKVKRKLDKLESEYTSEFRVSTELNTRKAQFEILTQKGEEIGQKLDKLRPLIDKLNLYKMLVKAYSSKGLKLNAVNNILYQIEQNYNRYAPLIFAERFKFKVDATEAGVRVMVDRGNGNVSDVRQLSGAESDCFRLLHFLTCLIMAPDERRTNIAVLDEPDSHMDDATATLFAERYIPFMRKLVPHTFLISQKGKHKYSDCSYLTVQKHKGVSKIITA